MSMNLFNVFNGSKDNDHITSITKRLDTNPCSFL